MLRENNKEIREKLFNEIKDLPIIDYHCHLSPKEIYLDEPFSDIGDLWLSYDHYKWRLG
jgi:glucuronate isomerase